MQSKSYNTAKHSPPPSLFKPEPVKKGRFHSHSNPLPVCAVCLGCHQHCVIACTKETT
ncbi:hypothetical protein SCLCIDRAFT_121598 [Scleroderma citrinum Foug A]|uniref:Uncharacterized protein n=1 Tax=Scleroderma citrinum Foug A TaxID=1036808 RepID=A0A0C3E0M1_9AGAM|nr:hypothetical protein SCLCIDRAFT_121598 [Scleroderma citrinum Foug A]